MNWNDGRIRPVYPERGPLRRIDNFDPHYTNERFRDAQTVYLAHSTKLIAGQYDGERVEGAEYNYSDRLRQWYSWDKYEKAWHKATEQVAEVRCAKHDEIYLRLLTDDPKLKLVHIMAGFNLATGDPYQVFGYHVRREGRIGCQSESASRCRSVGLRPTKRAS